MYIDRAIDETDVSVDGEVTVYMTKSGMKYYRESCRWENVVMKLAKARESYEPCGVCNPPKRRILRAKCF